MASALPCGGSTNAPPYAPAAVQHPLKLPRILPAPPKDQAASIVGINRRSFLLPFPLFFFSSTSPADASPPDLEPYTDRVEGFTLLRPSTWVQKAGATGLFEEGKGSNNIGIVVNPVSLWSLRDFGAPEFVADKLIQAESRKESTKDVKLITVDERLGHSGLPAYEFEYLVDSTRGGMRRIFSAAIVASKKLYLLNIAYSDRPENPLDTDTRIMLEQHLLIGALGLFLMSSKDR